MTPLFGHTRSVLHRNYALLDPAGFVPSALPGWSHATLHAVITPALGAKFVQLHANLQPGGTGEGNTGGTEFSAYVISGKLQLKAGGSAHRLSAGDFFYVPPHSKWSLSSARGATVVIFEKQYAPLEEVATPRLVVGRASDVPGQPFLGDPDARLQVLLPDVPEFDMAMNIFTYQPGATLPMVETHVMEHGLVMLSGQGIYRLGADWFPVRAGDVIWMGPHCPQWFVAMGKEPASYLYYKDVNRPLL